MGFSAEFVRQWSPARAWVLIPFSRTILNAIDYRTALAAVLQAPEYQANLDWGEPRRGHPEGTVRAHIAELERNLDRLAGRVTSDEAVRLRLLIHVHDTFKGEAQEGVPIADPRSHASLARQFLARFCDDADLLNMVQVHDEPYALWQQVRSKGACNAVRFEALLALIREWNLFVAFLLVDGCTVGKGREPLEWFLLEVGRRIPISWTVEDVRRWD